MAALEWLLAIEPARAAENADSPEQVRRAWIHLAPQDQVLGLYRAVREEEDGAINAPWWLAALDRGDLPSREAGFAFEGEIHRLLSERGGWVYVPWVNNGEDGYWEYAPSDAGLGDTQPTTLLLTAAHSGWINVVPASTDSRPRMVPMRGPIELGDKLPEIESWRIAPPFPLYTTGGLLEASRQPGQVPTIATRQRTVHGQDTDRAEAPAGTDWVPEQRGDPETDPDGVRQGR